MFRKGIIPMSFCPKCNKEYSDDLSACPYCDSVDSNNALQENSQADNTDNENTQEFFGEFNNPPIPSPDDNNGKKPFPIGVLIGVVAAVVVVVAAILIVVFCFSGNSDKNNTASTSGSSSAVEDFTMPSGYEDVIKNIKDDNGNIITEATDPYGNTVTREVDENGNVVTTYIGPDGETSTVTTDTNGNVISYNIPSASSTASNNNSTASSNSNTSSSTSSNNTSSANTSSTNNSSNNSSSGNTSTVNPSGDEVLINGKSYKVGDTVTFTTTAEGINEAVAGFYFTISYDENLLELDKSSLKYPDGGCLANTNEPGTILVCGISVSQGYNFSMPCDAVVCKFKVKASTSKACDITAKADEVYTGIGSNDVVDVTNDVVLTTTVD